jgi:hypothetical protein
VAAPTDEAEGSWRAQLFRAEAARIAGRNQDAAALARAIETEAGAAELRASAAILLGRIAIEAGDPAEAERHFHDGFTTALAAGRNDIAGEAAGRLAVFVGVQRRYEAFDSWSEIARAAFVQARLPDSDPRTLALAVGAAQGMAETRDARFSNDLMAIASDPKANEQARIEACLALAAVGTDAQIAALPAKVLSPHSTGPAGEVERLCYLEAMGRRSAGERTVDLLPLLGRKPDEAQAAARALGRNGVVASARPTLTAALDVPSTAVAAGLALRAGPRAARA